MQQNVNIGRAELVFVLSGDNSQTPVIFKMLADLLCHPITYIVVDGTIIFIMI